MITGKTLIDLGYKPAPWFKEALLRLTVTRSVKTEAMIRAVCDELDEKIVLVEPRLQPSRCELFVEAQHPDERANLLAVQATMNEVLRTPLALYGEVMPDACPAGPIGTIPVGGMVAVENAIIPGMHSADVCCSLLASNFGPNVDMKELMDIAFTTTQFGPGKRKGHGGWSNLVFDDASLCKRIERNFFTQDFIEKAAAHIGTQGDGNHFLFIGTSEQTGQVHMVTHHGSRGFGASVFKKGMAAAEKFRRKYSPRTLPQNAWLPYDDELGKEYWEALQIVKDWTFLNHNAIHGAIANKIGVGRKEIFWNEHNFVFQSSDPAHKNIFFHAKGVTPVSPLLQAGNSSKRIIPMNMAEPILIVEAHPESPSLFAPHGAGRNMSRSEFGRRGNTKETLKKEIAHLDVRFYSGLPDASEYPSAYKNAQTVVEQLEQFKLCNVIDRIMPYGSIMAGEQEAFWSKK